jgi:tetratricopeptide (TPR) repeat protein
MALAWMDLKKSEEAIRELESSVQSPYVAPEMYLTLGSQYLEKRRYREAEEVVKKGIALDPTRPEGYLNLAQLYNVQGWSDRALAELKRAIPEGKSFPTSAYYQQVQADVVFETGKAYQAKRLVQPAIQAYLRTLEFDPNRGQAHRRLAEVYVQQGDYGRAFTHATMAEKLGSPVEPALRGEILRRRAEPAFPKPGVPR